MDVQTRFHDDDGRLVVERVQDCEPVLESAKRLHNEGVHGSREMRHVARFPKVLVEKYCNQHGITLHEWLVNPVHAERMLNDPDLKYFRVGA